MRADEFSAPPPRGGDDRDWCEPAEAARRMKITMGALDDLIRRGGVRTRRIGWAIEVEPCIINVQPSETPSPRRASAAKPRTPRGRK